MKYTFYKYQGTGNDFILFDNRNKAINLTQKQIEFLCDRKFGIGADGLMLLQNKDGFDFEMIYFNSDGKISSMCGNGGRCITAFANKLGIKKSTYYFLAIDGPHYSKIRNNDFVELKMNNVSNIETSDNHFYMNTGSPHYVVETENLDNLHLVNEARKIRYSTRFEEEGTNVNYIQKTKEGIAVRTYERGVEDETLSCGTGVTACAISSYLKKWTNKEVVVLTKGGTLEVSFEEENNLFKNIWLKGSATFVFKGEIDI